MKIIKCLIGLSLLVPMLAFADGGDNRANAGVVCYRGESTVGHYGISVGWYKEGNLYGCHLGPSDIHAPEACMKALSYLEGKGFKLFDTTGGPYMHDYGEAFHVVSYHLVGSADAGEKACD